jgi:predicted nucleotidyltransferase
MDKNQILELIRRNRELVESKGAMSFALFASYSEDSQRQDSDIDILVKYRESDKNYDNFIELAISTKRYNFFLNRACNATRKNSSKIESGNVHPQEISKSLESQQKISALISKAFTNRSFD